MTTEEALEAITDEGVFERLITSVLRTAEPKYARLLHVGINAAGKTVKAPVDGFLPAGTGQTLAATAYTTTAAPKLRAKWLHPHKGDVPKAISVLIDARRTDMTISAVLILGTNRTPDISLLSDISAVCRDHNIELDLWDRSRLATYLDIRGDGQWLRSRFLGIHAELLSQALFKELAAQSITRFASQIPGSDRLTMRKAERDLLRRIAFPGMTFLVGASGFGKSAIALRAAQILLDRGLPPLWLPEAVLEREDLLGSALLSVLSDLNRFPLRGEALGVYGSDPLLVIIDDVARTNNPIRNLLKVLGWRRGLPQDIGQRDSARVNEGNVHLLVPVWPEHVGGIPRNTRRDLGPLIYQLLQMDADEASAAYRLRHGAEAHRMTDAQILQVIDRLGRDPLLIDLHNPTRADEGPEEVVHLWIEKALIAVSLRTGFSVHRLRTTLSRIGRAMLEHRSLTPTGKDVEDWFREETAECKNALIELMRAREILRWDHEDGSERLLFRHDRVRDAILADALRIIGEENFKHDVLSDPYFADLLAAVLIQQRFDANWIAICESVNPLALFAALKIVGQPKRSLPADVVTAVKRVLHAQGHGQRLPMAFNLCAGGMLDDTDGIQVAELCQILFGSGPARDEARLRNGDIEAAIRYVLNYPPSLTYPRRNDLIRHAAELHETFVPRIAELLSIPNLNDLGRRGLLLLAGYVARPELEGAVAACLQHNAPRGPDQVAAAFWAVTQCAKDQLDSLLDLVLDGVAALSSASTNEGQHVSEREHLFLDCGIREMARFVPKQVVPTLLSKVHNRADMRVFLVGLLREVDDPRVLDDRVRRTAQDVREAKAGGKETWFYFQSDPAWRGSERVMTDESRCALEKIWLNPLEAGEERQLAFRYWRSQATAADIGTVRQVAHGGEIGDEALGLRVHLGDKTAFGEFVVRMRAIAPGEIPYWWQFARGVMDEELARGLEETIARSEIQCEDVAWPLSELLMELPADLAESIIVRLWDMVGDKRRYIHAALFVNSAGTRTLAGEAIKRAPDASEIFRHIMSSFGFYTSGRSECITLSHVEALEPYLDNIDEPSLRILWRECNRRRWYEWRRRNLDKRVYQISDGGLRADLEWIKSQLDKLAAERHVWSTWFEHHFIALGYSPDEAFGAIVAWAKERGGPDALSVAIDLFANEAARHHLPLFDQLNDGQSNFAEARNNVHFVVKRRGLT